MFVCVRVRVRVRARVCVCVCVLDSTNDRLAGGKHAEKGIIVRIRAVRSSSYSRIH